MKIWTVTCASENSWADLLVVAPNEQARDKMLARRYSDHKPGEFLLAVEYDPDADLCLDDPSGLWGGRDISLREV